MSTFSVENNGPSRRRRAAADAALPQLDKLFDKVPPHSLEAEMALLGSMILDHRVIADIVALIRGPEDFYREAHGQIYQSLVEVYDRSHSGDLVQIQDALRRRGVHDAVGGGEYLLRLAEAVPSAVNAPHYAKIVAEKAKLRRLIDASGRILYEAYHAGELGPEGAREVLDRAEMSVFEIAQEQQIADPQALKELLQIEMDRLEASDGKGFSGLPTGYYDLDDLLRGLQKGEMIIVAARPSMGKTALALNIAEQVALGGKTAGEADGATHPIALFSLEMSKSAVTQRLISARSGVSSHHLRSGHNIDFKRVIMACGELEKAPIYVDDTPNMTVLTLRARARRLVAQHGVKAIIIDYLQLLTAPGASRESRQVEVSAISRGIKALARELNVPVICLSQLNRASEQREGNRPRMSDLRESGSIEQDADVVILLHREDYYHTQDSDWALENPDKAGVAELIVAKQRNGPTGIVKLVWDAATTRFKNYARQGGGYGGEFAAPAGHTAHASEAPPWNAEPKPIASTFPVRPPTGPVGNFRDGGGPDADDELPV